MLFTKFIYYKTISIQLFLIFNLNFKMDPQQPKFDENEVKAKIDKDLKNMSILKDMFSKFAKIENGILNKLSYIKYKQIIDSNNKIKLNNFKKNRLIKLQANRFKFYQHSNRRKHM